MFSCFDIKRKLQIGRWKQIADRILKFPVWLWLVIILIISFFLKLLCWHLDPVVSRDGCFYLWIAQVWHDAGSFQKVCEVCPGLWIPPLPLYLVKSLMCLGLSAETAGVWLSLVLGSFSPLLAYGIVHEVTQRKDFSLCSALLIAVSPAINGYAHEIQRDMIYLFFVGIALWLLTAGIRREKWGYWLGVGLACGCSMLTRFETLEFLVIVPVSLLFLSAARYLSWKKMAVFFGIFFLAFCGSISLLTLLMQTQTVFLQNYGNYYQGKLTNVEKQFRAENGITGK